METHISETRKNYRYHTDDDLHFLSYFINLREKKETVFKKKENRNKNKNEKNKSLDIKIVNYKVLNKTGDMAIIISKLKEIRDHKISKIKEKKHSNKIKQEIRKLNETIALAEDLFKKELLNL